jgi:hypothetical protein
LTILIAEHFQFTSKWYRGEPVAALVLEYYVVLRSVLRAKPHRRKCLSRCRHCGIFFLTDPRNAGRCDLGCPFGCSQAHRRRESIRRSTDYYRGEEGRKYKRRQNQRQQEKRRLLVVAGEPSEGNGLASLAQPNPLCELKAEDPGVRPLPPTAVSPPDSQFSFPPLAEHLLQYLQRVVSLIEERPVSWKEILEMLQRVFRQRSICRHRRLDHIVAWLHEHPP